MPRRTSENQHWTYICSTSLSGELILEESAYTGSGGGGGGGGGGGAYFRMEICVFKNPWVSIWTGYIVTEIFGANKDTT